ncbi:MAG: hypothetical protein RL693_1255 [Verrucomicrobiota bacterium]|jgi:hypothetical protein
MTKPNLKVILAACAASIIGVLIVAAAIYITFFQGTTPGPDFVAVVQSGQIGDKDVKSVEVIVPPQGHDAFDEGEYAALRRTSVVDSPPAIAELLARLRGAGTGRVSQNHPATIYISYWRINLFDGGFYYLYVKVLRDASDTVCYVDANTKGATNPNGATFYRIDDFRSMLRVIDEAAERQLAEPPN